MPYAPQYTPQTGAPRGPQSFLRAVDNGGGLGGAVATGLQQGGEALSRYAEVENQIQEKHDDQFSRRQAIEYRREAQTILSEYDQLEGDNAIEQAETTRERLSELRARYMEQSGNERMRRFFEARTDDFALGADTGIIDRSVSQQHVMDLALNAEEANQYLEGASISWGNLEQHTSDIADVRRLANETAELKGLSGDLRSDFVRSKVSQARRAAVLDMLTDEEFSTDAAIGYFNDHKADFVMTDRNAVQQDLREPTRQRWAAGQFNEIASGAISSPHNAGSGDTPEGGSVAAPIQPAPEASRVSSGSGMRRHPVTGEQAMHHGIDYAAPAGSSVVSVADGVVTRNFFQEGKGGWVVSVQHPDGREASYLHMQGASNFSVGDRVTRGQIIGTVGSTGSSTGPHLDFRVKDAPGGAWINPEDYLEGAVPVGQPSDPRNWDRATVFAEIDRREAEGLYSFEEAEYVRATADRRMSRDESLLADRAGIAGDNYATWLVDNTNFTDPSQVPEEIRRDMTPAQLLRVTETAQANAKNAGEGLRDGTEIYLRNLRDAEPDTFRLADLTKYQPYLEPDAYARLISDQHKVRVDYDEEGIRWTPDSGVRTAFNLGKSNSVVKYEDADDELAVRSLMMRWAYARFEENGGKPLTDAEYQEAYRYATQNVQARVPRMIFGMEVGDGYTEEMPRYEVGNDVRTAIQEVEEIQQVRDEGRHKQRAEDLLTSKFFQKYNRPPTSLEMARMLEDYLGN